jgi:hypothetical protein
VKEETRDKFMEGITKNLSSSSHLQISPKKVLIGKRIKTLLIFLFLLVGLTISLSCKKTPVEPEVSINLTFDDVTCTEVWYRLSYYNFIPPVKATIYLNDEGKDTITISTNDTIMYIGGLKPKQRYNLYIELEKGGITKRSNTMQFETMDTTSRNFTWQIYEFGDYGNSVLFDVAIIDENNIWAVGQIYMFDSLGNHDPRAYNAIHWDGKEWKLLRIKAFSSCNPVDYPPIRSIWAFDSNNIVFMTGGSVIRYNGSKYQIDCSIRPLLNNRLNKLWSRGSENLYAVGYDGMIAHWDGVRWNKVEITGENTEIVNETKLTDIYGSATTGRIFVSGYTTDYRHRSVLLEIKNNRAEVLWATRDLQWKDPYGTTITNIYVKDNFLFICGSRGYFRQNIKLNTKPVRITDIQPDWVYQFKGTDINNIFTFTDFGEIYHYNGVNIRKILLLSQGVYVFYGGSAKDNLVVGVGFSYKGIYDHKAFIVIGKRL